MLEVTLEKYLTYPRFMNPTHIIFGVVSTLTMMNVGANASISGKITKTDVN